MIPTMWTKNEEFDHCREVSPLIGLENESASTMFLSAPWSSQCFELATAMNPSVLAVGTHHNHPIVIKAVIWISWQYHCYQLISLLVQAITRQRAQVCGHRLYSGPDLNLQTSFAIVI